MTSIFGKIGKGLEHLGQQVGNEVKHVLTGDPTPDPRQLSNGTPVGTSSSSSNASPFSNSSNASSLASSSGNPLGGSSPSLPLSGSTSLPSGISQQQATQIYSAAKSNPDLAGVIQTIGDDIGSVVGFLGKFLPHNADGSVDWGGIAGDIGGFLKDNAKTIINGLSAYEQYQRQGQSDKYLQEALNGIPGTDYKGAIANYAAKQPLRDAGQAGLLNPRANTPDLSSLKAQGQQGATLQASLPMANPNQAQGMANLRNLAGANSGNPFGSTLPLATASTAPGMPSVTPPGQTGQTTHPTLPIAPQGPSLNPVPVPPGGPQPGQIQTPVLPPIGPGGAPTTTNTQAKKAIGTGLYSAQGVTPLDENPDGLLPYGQALRLKLAGT